MKFQNQLSNKITLAWEAALSKTRKDPVSKYGRICCTCPRLQIKTWNDGKVNISSTHTNTPHAHKCEVYKTEQSEKDYNPRLCNTRVLTQATPWGQRSGKLWWKSPAWMGGTTPCSTQLPVWIATEPPPQLFQPGNHAVCSINERGYRTRILNNMI